MIGEPFYKRRTYRICGAVLGLMLVGVAVYAIAVKGVDEIYQAVAAGVMLVAGVNMVWSACKGDRSWVSKLGPLP